MFALTTEPDFRLPSVERELTVAGDVTQNLGATMQALGIARALADQRPDDVTIEIDQTRDRLHVRVRAYRHRS